MTEETEAQLQSCWDGLEGNSPDVRPQGEGGLT